ncbi:MAG: glycoside hydrolase family 127 protein [Ruminococcus sp.]|nr:glycoside hydrolase family 127 protein [Ruminococcus sp.]
MKVQSQLKTHSYTPEGFIGDYCKLVTQTVIPYQYSVLKDEAPDTEKSHVYQNFLNAADVLAGGGGGDGFYGMVFQDSDAAKWIEAAAFSLANTPDPALEKTVDDFIDIIARAQDTDGYLDTCFTIKDKDRRYTNLLEAHELYCSGHFMEAACAYFEATGKRKLLDVMLKNAEHLYDRFITNGAPGYPGHPEIELALLKLYRTTKNDKCLQLARHFIDTRGTDPAFYSKEAEKRDWSVWNSDPWDNAYRQADKPARRLTDATGHAVRAVYLYTAMADLASSDNDSELYDACKRLWQSITKRRMYVTGGIGSTVHGEAFSVDFDLPSDTAYAETCASCGLMFFASRMLENEVNGEYADVMERAFYNTVLAGMQLDGKRFFYVNPLEVNIGISGISPTHRHDLPVRPKWYACACCPPNVARTIESFGKYAYGESSDTAYCHLFAAGKVSFENGISLECKTGYPYELDVKYHVSGSGRLAVRLPGWSHSTTVRVNGDPTHVISEKGYMYFDIDGSSEIELCFDKDIKRIYSNPVIPALTGKVCLMRGPLVYCFEGKDNGGSVADISLTDGDAVTALDDSLPGVTVIDVQAVRASYDGDSLYSDKAPEYTPITARAVPYYTWGNRGENQMRVWTDHLA